MKKYIFSALLLLVINFAFGQDLLIPGGCVIGNEATSEQVSTENLNTGDPSVVKVVRVNIHYTLRTDGTGNFTETGSSADNYLTGYQFAADVIDDMNYRQTWNPQMALLPGNTTVNPPKNYLYVLEAVYFHRNDALYTAPSVTTSSTQQNSLVLQHNDSLLNIIYSGGYAIAGNSASGFASNLSEYSKIKYTVIGRSYQRYLDYLSAPPGDDDYSWVLHAIARTTEHEIGHLLGLSHTVMWNWGTVCPSTATSTCGDHCSDTPSMYELSLVVPFGIQPYGHCPWSSGGWCSNNMMDYGTESALTPCQLERIHDYLDGGMASYKQCSALYTNLTICDLGAPYLAYNGKNVTIGECASGAVLNGQETMSIYFSESVSLKNFEVSDNGTFEVVFASNCD